MKQVSEADSGKSSAWKVTVLSREEQYDLKRKVLIQEAARAFSTRGYHATSLADVARELGVTKGAHYYYVKSKQDILFECHVNSIALGDRAIEHARSIDGSGFDSVVALARRYMELLVGESGPLAILTEFNALEPENRKIVAAGRTRFGNTFLELIERGQADGSVHGAINGKMAEFFYLGAVNWATRWFDAGGELDGSLVAAQFADLFAAAIRA